MLPQLEEACPSGTREGSKNRARSAPSVGSESSETTITEKPEEEATPAMTNRSFWKKVRGCLGRKNAITSEKKSEVQDGGQEKVK